MIGKFSLISLDPVYAQYDYIRLIVLAVLVLLDMYAAGLWCFAYVRTALPFCLVLALASLGALFGAVIATAFAYDLAGIKRFDPANIIYGFSFFVLQPLVALVAIVGQTWLVTWLIRAKANKSHKM